MVWCIGLLIYIFYVWDSHPAPVQYAFWVKSIYGHMPSETLCWKTLKFHATNVNSTAGIDITFKLFIIIKLYHRLDFTKQSTCGYPTSEESFSPKASLICSATVLWSQDFWSLNPFNICPCSCNCCFVRCLTMTLLNGIGRSMTSLFSRAKTHFHNIFNKVDIYYIYYIWYFSSTIENCTHQTIKHDNI